MEIICFKIITKSADPQISEKWMEAKEVEIDDYKKLISLWRNQNLYEEEAK